MSLREHGFTDIETKEVLVQGFNIYNITMPLADLGEDLEDANDDLYLGKVTLKSEMEDIAVTSDKQDKKVKKEQWSMKADDKGQYAFKSAVPLSDIPGHTGYLTFASLINKNSLKME